MKKTKKRIIVSICILIVLAVPFCCLKSCNHKSEPYSNASKLEADDQLNDDQKNETADKERDGSYSHDVQNKLVANDEKETAKQEIQPSKKDDVPVDESVEVQNEEKIPLVEENNPVHVHKWNAVYKTIRHEEVGHSESILIKDAWVEIIPVYEYQYRDICNGCGKDITGRSNEHMESQMMAGHMECSGFTAKQVEVQTGEEEVYHDAVYYSKWIVDEPAYNEKVVDYYICECGKRK